MFKNTIRLFLLVFFVAAMGQAFAVNLPDLTEGEKAEVKTDSSTVNKDNDLIQEKGVKIEPAVKSKEITQSNIFKEDETVEEDSTSNSALSFNFIYYIIEKFKFQVE